VYARRQSIAVAMFKGSRSTAMHMSNKCVSPQGAINHVCIRTAETAVRAGNLYTQVACGGHTITEVMVHKSRELAPNSIYYCQQTVIYDHQELYPSQNLRTCIAVTLVRL
jgi:hypothetical protein